MGIDNTSRNLIAVASADSELITTTSATDVLTYYVERDGNFRITPYVAVKNGTTGVSLSVSWTDPEVGAATYSWYTSASKVVGIYTLPSQLITAVMGSAITISITVSIANNVYLSATIETGEW